MTSSWLFLGISGSIVVCATGCSASGPATGTHEQGVAYGGFPAGASTGTGGSGAVAGSNAFGGYAGGGVGGTNPFGGNGGSITGNGGALGGTPGLGGTAGGGSAFGGTPGLGGTSASGGSVTTSSGGSAGSNGGAGGTSGPDGGGNIPHGACLDGITNYEADGPFMVQMMTMGSINFWVPSVPSGCKVPVIHLSNGTGATCSVYAPALQRMATQGFLATCYEDPNTGAGTDALQALEAALSMFPDLADNKFGSTGHSQGGQAAFTGLALAEQKYGNTMLMAGLAMEPASGFGTQPTGGTWQAVYATIKSPMFMFSGLGTDGLVSQAWVQEAYDATSMTEEAYFWTAMGATHIPVPNAQEEEISIPWFRWKLLGDQKACAFFKAIPMTDTIWAQVAAKNTETCQ